MNRKTSIGIESSNEFTCEQKMLGQILMDEKCFQHLFENDTTVVEK